MSIFFNVVGILAMLSGPAALFLSRDPGAQLIGGVVLLLAVVALGFGKLLEHAKRSEEAETKHRAKVLELLRSIANGQEAPATVSAPPIPRWHVRNGDENIGPFTESQLWALKQKGVITNESKLAAEGSGQWQPVDKVLATAAV